MNTQNKKKINRIINCGHLFLNANVAVQKPDTN